MLCKLVFRGAFPKKKKLVKIKEDNKFVEDKDYYAEYSFGNVHFSCIHIKKEISRGTLIYFHANAIQLGKYLYLRMERLSNILSMSVVAIEYPGYGLSQQTCTIDNFFATGEAAVNYFHTGCYENTPLILYGHSIGCVLCSKLASLIPDISGVILESPPSNLLSFAGILTYCLPKSIKKESKRLDCSVYYSHITCPKLVILGSKDNFNSKHAKQFLLQSINDDDSLLYLEGFGHNNIPYGSRKGKCMLTVPSFCKCCMYVPAVESKENEYYICVTNFVSKCKESTFFITSSRSSVVCKDKDIYNSATDLEKSSTYNTSTKHVEIEMEEIKSEY